ncbi:hypothetical protein JXQ31_14860 [candidate division KSB1 bacterium]|nr:hypothetical protein [candidate division KSB1 bacterium]
MKYEPKKELQRLNQIIDSAYFVRSHHSSMAQVVDILSFFLRLYIEINYYGFQEAYNGENDKITRWIEKVKDKFVSYSVIYPNKKSNFIKLLNNMKVNGFVW